MTETPVAPTLPGLLYQQAAEWQASLDALDARAAAQMAEAWVGAGVRQSEALDRFLDAVEARRAAGQPVSPSWAYREARYREFIATAQAEAEQFARTAAGITQATQADAAALGASGAAAMGSAAVAGAGIAATFVGLNPATMTTLAGFLQDGSPLVDLFESLAPESTAAVRQALTTGIVGGRGIPRLRRDLRRALDIPRWRAETIARTEAHRVFREASRRTYSANADVLEGWVWTAHLDRTTCPGCMAMHGTVMPVGETLDGHPRCRCAMVPRVKPWGDIDPSLADLPDTRPPMVTGEAWLRRQPATTQRAILGPGKYQAWREGHIGVQDMAARTRSDRWGTMHREATLTEARAAATLRGVRQPAMSKADAAALRSTVAQMPKPSKVAPGPVRLADRLEASGGVDGIRDLHALTGGTNDVVNAGTLADGTPVVVRTVRDPRSVDAEELRTAVAQRLGAPVPDLVRVDTHRTVQVRLNGSPASAGGASFTDAEADRFAAAVRAHPADARALALLDDATFNVDRHLGNVFIGPDGALSGIDHAARLPKTSNSAGIAAPGGEFTDLLDAKPATLAETERMLSALEAEAAHAERLGRSQEWTVLVERMRRRRDRLAASAGDAAPKVGVTNAITPEPVYVDRLHALLRSGEVTPAQLRAHVLNAPPLSQANARAAIERFEAGRATAKPLEFASAQDARDWASSVWPGPAGYPGDELAALRSYTGSGYGPMNTALRNGRTTKATDAMDRAMDRAPAVPADIQVIRNANLRSLGITATRTDPRTLVGSEYLERGYLSTSVNRRGAMQGEVRLTLNVPKGSRGVYVSGSGGRPGPSLISEAGGGESELILARGTSFRVTSVRKVGDRWHVEADVIGQDGVS